MSMFQGPSGCFSRRVVIGKEKSPQEFSIADDSEEDQDEANQSVSANDELSNWYENQDESNDESQIVLEVEEIQQSQRQYVRTVTEPNLEGHTTEIILDSGADCHVLPMSWQVGVETGTQYALRDAQGNSIATSAVREKVTFEFAKEPSTGKFQEEGERPKFKLVDEAVLGNVTQPLCAVGKLWKLGWSMVHENSQLYLKKGSTRIKVGFAHNSATATACIYRVAENASSSKDGQIDSQVRVIKIPRSVIEELEEEMWNEDWSALSDGTPVHFAWNATKTTNPAGKFKVQVPLDKPGYHFRTTLTAEVDEDSMSIKWDTLDLFECCEEWKGREELNLGEFHGVIITLMEMKVKDPEEYGVIDPERGKEREQRKKNPEKTLDKLQELVVDVQLPPNAQESIAIGPVLVTPESSLKDLKVACKYLQVSPYGTKKLLWDRILSTIARNKLQTQIQISEDLKREMEREPQVQPRTPMPLDPAEIEKHEVTHMPFAEWCEHCQKTRSREDNFAKVKKPAGAVFSIDYMFTGTSSPSEEDPKVKEKDPLAIQLIGVDHLTKFCIVIPVSSKGEEHFAMATKEFVRVLNLLDHEKVTLRTDTEPSMLALRDSIVKTRLRDKLATEVQDATPDLHQGLGVERYVRTIRDLAKCLISTIESKTKTTISSSSQIYAWSFRHAAWIYNRFHVSKDGTTSFERLLDRPYRGRLSPFGSTVIAKPVPVVKTEGDSWMKGIFLGRSYSGNLALIGTPEGVIHARSYRACSQMWQPQFVLEMKGVPWNYALDYKAKSRRRGKIPMLINLPPKEKGNEQIGKEGQSKPEYFALNEGDSEGPGPDEAGSDPESVFGSPASDPGEVRIDDSMSLEELRNSGLKREGLEESSQPAREPKYDEGSSQPKEREAKVPKIAEGSPKSAVMYPPFYAGRAEGVEAYPSREEQLEYHDDELLDLDQFKEWFEEIDEMDDKDEQREIEDEEFGEEQIEGLSFELEGWSPPTWSQNYEDGAPKLSDEDLSKLDLLSDAEEVTRLLEMGVIRPPKDDEPVDTYKQLSTKKVYDWRYRDGWKRRSRLVAREYKWLESMDISDLYSPTSVASTIKVLASLCASHNGNPHNEAEELGLYSYDISDAYLMVPQEESATVVVNGVMYVLEYTLPGQRVGAKSWWQLFAKVLQELDYVPYEGLPSMFYKRPKDLEANDEQSLGSVMSTHVDDIQVLCTATEAGKLEAKFKEKNFKFKKEGPVGVGYGCATYLKRTFKGDKEGIRILMDSKYEEKLEEVLEIQKAAIKKIP